MLTCCAKTVLMHACSEPIQVLSHCITCPTQKSCGLILHKEWLRLTRAHVLSWFAVSLCWFQICLCMYALPASLRASTTWLSGFQAFRREETVTVEKDNLCVCVCVCVCVCPCIHPQTTIIHVLLIQHPLPQHHTHNGKKYPFFHSLHSNYKQVRHFCQLDLLYLHCAP